MKIISLAEVRQDYERLKRAIKCQIFGVHAFDIEPFYFYGFSAGDKEMKPEPPIFRKVCKHCGLIKGINPFKSR